MDKKDNGYRPTTQLNLLVRVLIGGYLIYLAWSLRGSFDKPLILVAAIAFALIGAALAVVSIRRIFTGEFDFVDDNGNVIIPDDLPEDEE